MDPDASWDRQVLQFARGFRRSLLEHPGLVDMLIAQLPGPPLDPAREHVLTLLLDAGLDRRTSVEVIATVFSYTLGFAVAQRAQRISNADEGNRIARLPKDHFPNLTSTSAEYGDHLSDETFERGLRDLTSAVQRRCTPNC